MAQIPTKDNAVVPEKAAIYLNQSLSRSPLFGLPLGTLVLSRAVKTFYTFLPIY